MAAALLGAFDTGWLLTVDSCALAALLLAPFASLALYQIPFFLFWREMPHGAS